MKYLGENSLIIMATHQVLLEKFINVVTGGQYTYLTGLLMLVLIVSIEIPIIYIINRYMPFMIGKFPKKKNVQTVTD